MNLFKELAMHISTMNYNRGDIVIVSFPFILSGGQKAQKARPALVISDNIITFVANMTGNL